MFRTPPFFNQNTPHAIANNHIAPLKTVHMNSEKITNATANIIFLIHSSLVQPIHENKLLNMTIPFSRRICH